MTVRRLISKGQSNDISFIHTSPCGFSKQEPVCFLPQSEKGSQWRGKGVGSLKPWQCVNVPATKMSCQLTSKVSRDSVDGGLELSIQVVRVMLWGFHLFVFNIIVGSSQSDRLIYIAEQSTAFAVSSRLKWKYPYELHKQNFDWGWRLQGFIHPWKVLGKRSLALQRRKVSPKAWREMGGPPRGRAPGPLAQFCPVLGADDPSRHSGHSAQKTQHFQKPMKMLFLNNQGKKMKFQVEEHIIIYNN